MIQKDASQLLHCELDWQSVFDRLEGADARISLVVTGGGTRAIAKCLGRAGASRLFVEAVVPYSRSAVTEFLGHELESPSVCEATAVALAKTAASRVKRLADDHSGVAIGIALTAALPTEPPRDHQDAIYVAMESELGSKTWFVELPKDQYDRTTAEQIAEAMVWRAMLDYLK